MYLLDFQASLLQSCSRWSIFKFLEENGLEFENCGEMGTKECNRQHFLFTNRPQGAS